MNRLKKGPELKMPELKVPAALGDLFYDLRERRLLPLIALVLVAIVAVPFLLGDPVEAPPPPPAAAAAGEAGAGASKLTVVEATPGLRDYRKRLKGTPTDPFEQRYTSANLKGADLPDEKGGEGGGKGGSGKEGSEGGSGGGGEAEPAGGDGTARPGELVLYAFAINVRITRSGGEGSAAGEKPEPIVKERVLPQTPLPGEKAPVVTYMGASKKMTDLNQPRVLLLVSPDVKSVFGDARCVSGDETCQLLEVEPGFPETFVYGENEVRYTINIVKAGFVVTDRRRR